jgi:hypothetical protein
VHKAPNPRLELSLKDHLEFLNGMNLGDLLSYLHLIKPEKAAKRISDEKLSSLYKSIKHLKKGDSSSPKRFNVNVKLSRLYNMEKLLRTCEATAHESLNTRTALFKRERLTSEL